MELRIDLLNCYYWLTEISKINNLKDIHLKKVDSKFKVLATKDFMNAHSIEAFNNQLMVFKTC